MINHAEIKGEARELIRTGRVSPLLVTAIVMVIGGVLNRVVNLVTYGTVFPETYDLQYIQNILSGMDTDAALQAATEMVFVRDTMATEFLSILVSLFLTVLMGGYYHYLMGIRQRWEMGCDSLFDGLAVAGKLIWCEILMGIKVALWSMLFVIPGIVAMYRYRFAIYNIMADDSLSASEAIALSCRQTNGMKWDLLILDVSFIGWDLLSGLTLNLLNIWVQPYKTLSDLAYFEEGQRRADCGRSSYGGSYGAPDDPWNNA